jgi:hypothetical protein
MGGTPSQRPSRFAWHGPLLLGEALSAPQSRTLLLGSLLELSFAHCTKANFPTVKIFRMPHSTDCRVVAWIQAFVYRSFLSYALLFQGTLHCRQKVPTAAACRSSGAAPIRRGTSTAKQHSRLHGCHLPARSNYCRRGKFAP